MAVDGIRATREMLNVVGRAELFRSLPRHEQAQVAGLLRPLVLDAGAELVREGAPAARVVVVASGEAEVLHAHAVIGNIGPVSIIGEAALLAGTTYGATVRAVSPVRGYELDAADFALLRNQFDPLAFDVLFELGRTLAARVRTATADAGPAVTAADTAGRETSHPADPSRAAFLRELRLFASFGDEELAELVAHLCERRLPRGATLFAEGEQARGCAIVAEGALEVGVERRGRTIRFATLGPGRLVGELSLLDRGPRTATCTAYDDAVVIELSSEHFERLVQARSRPTLGLLEAVDANLLATLHRTHRRHANQHAAAAAAAATANQPRVDSSDALVPTIRASIIGDDAVLGGPFGPRRVVYADYTASARALSFVERFIRREVLPLYANTHTEASATGLQTTRLREDARRIIHRAVGGTDDDVVVFAGSGATGAIDKLVHVLGLRVPSALDEQWRLTGSIPPDRRPVVFIGPFEHHSNELPWRESIADVVVIREDADGHVDLDHLADELERHRDRPLKVGSFSAASNVTGIITDVDAVSILLHRHGAYACWDYAAAGPYVPIDMNAAPDRPDGHLAYKDALFVSPHKFVGGPGTPGVLVAKRSLFRNRVPAVPGGGTVAFVSPTGHWYHDDPVHREEGGTPAIVESIRAGLVFQVKEAVGANRIRALERAFIRRALDSWRANPRIELVGNLDAERLAIVSLGIGHERGLLHSNFVVALLNDLFGIQARSGCFCAGPYLHRLYAVAPERSSAFQSEIALGHHGAKLAFFRVGFNYFISETVFTYLVDAVHFVADHGWKLLPLYRFDPFTGLWHHVSGRAQPELTLHALSYDSGTLEVRGARASEGEDALPRYLEEAHRIVAAIEADPPHVAPQDVAVSEDFEAVRWFPLPSEALRTLLERSASR